MLREARRECSTVAPDCAPIFHGRRRLCQVAMPDKGRKVLLVIPGLTAGGAERVLVLLAGGLLARGYRVEVATIFGRQRDFFPLPEGARRIALDLGGETSGLADKLAGNLRRIAGLRRAMRAVAPDVVISFLSETNVLALLAAIGLHIPVIVTEHTDCHWYPPGRAWKILRRLSYGLAARLVSVSAGVDEGFAWLPPARRAVIHNPVRTEESEAAASPPLVFPWPHAILAMGRLEAEKGFDLLVDAFGRLAADFPAWGLAILGDGSLHAELSDQIAALGLGDRIRLPGVTASPAATLRQGDLFVLSSRHEGFGLALVEAMAVGLPVIATPRCGNVVEPGCSGWIVPEGNPQKLARAIREAIDSPEKLAQMRAEARKRAEEFSIERLGGELEKLEKDEDKKMMTEK